jgi:hypothetical protein
VYGSYCSPAVIRAKNMGRNRFGFA